MELGRAAEIGGAMETRMETRMETQIRIERRNRARGSVAPQPALGFGKPNFSRQG
jgi:hypothetical protein